MRRTWIPMLVLLVIVSGIASGCSLFQKEEEEVVTYTFTEGDEVDTITFGVVTLQIDSGYLEEDERNEIAAWVESAAAAAESYIGDTEPLDVIVQLNSGDGATMVYEGLVDVYYAENLTTPYTSLILQVMLGVDGTDEWIREGTGALAADLNEESFLDTQAHMIDVLTEYVEAEELAREEEAEENGEEFTESYYDIDTLASVLYAAGSYTEAAELGDMTLYIAEAETDQDAYNVRGAYCIYAGSFVKYLEETYGREAVLGIYAGDDFEETTGVTFDDAHEAWIATL